MFVGRGFRYLSLLDFFWLAGRDPIGRGAFVLNAGLVKGGAHTSCRTGQHLVAILGCAGLAPFKDAVGVSELLFVPCVVGKGTVGAFFD